MFERRHKLLMDNCAKRTRERRGSRLTVLPAALLADRVTAKRTTVCIPS